MPSEIYKQERMPGDMTEKESMEGADIKVLDYVVVDSKFKGKYCIVQARADYGLVTFIGNIFMLNQLRGLSKTKFPMDLKLLKKDGNWRFGKSD